MEIFFVLTKKLNKSDLKRVSSSYTLWTDFSLYYYLINILNIKILIINLISKTTQCPFTVVFTPFSAKTMSDTPKRVSVCVDGSFNIFYMGWEVFPAQLRLEREKSVHSDDLDTLFGDLTTCSSSYRDARVSSISCNLKKTWRNVPNKIHF